MQCGCCDFGSSCGWLTVSLCQWADVANRLACFVTWLICCALLLSLLMCCVMVAVAAAVVFCLVVQPSAVAGGCGWWLTAVVAGCCWLAAGGWRLWWPGGWPNLEQWLSLLTAAATVYAAPHCEGCRCAVVVCRHCHCRSVCHCRR